ncbi:chromate efflux transporter [Polymorphobacter sp.]|uniref:chromate efflux transporter n=1 Tax=Polymorphobacter sp. TaxID=1909290 RepID=UPI003F6FC7C2
MAPGHFEPPRLGLWALFGKFLGFGLLAFGGPVAQIAMLRQSLVAEGRWIDPARFDRLLAVLQALPGPEAHELCVHMGMIARGRLGGLVAGLGFMLPGLVLMLAAAWLYVEWIAGDPRLAPVLLGVQIVVLAVILRAAIRIGQHVIEDWALGVIAMAALLASVAGVPFWIILLAGGGLHAAAARPLVVGVVLVLAAGAAMAMAGVAAGDAPVAAGGPITLVALFIAGLKGGLLTFGGAYTAIPYVRADTVGRGWLDDATFLDGIALAGVLPAPLVIFATFVGYVAGGLAGALAITAGMFLPAFAFSLIFFERLEAAVEHPALHRFLTGVAAAVIGIIAETFVALGKTTALRVSSPLVAGALFGVALLVVWRVKGAWLVPLLVAAGAIAGALTTP